MARKVDPNAAAEAYQRGMGQAGDKYKKGIQNTTTNPMQAAADAEDLYLARVTEASTSGKRKQKLLATPVSRWKDNAINVGSARLVSGAQKAADKVKAHFQQWAPIYQQVSDETAAMPKGGMANAQARASRAIEILMRAAGRS